LSDCGINLKVLCNGGGNDKDKEINIKVKDILRLKKHMPLQRSEQQLTLLNTALDRHG
jgi:hypothetical protein